MSISLDTIPTRTGFRLEDSGQHVGDIVANQFGKRYTVILNTDIREATDTKTESFHVLSAAEYYALAIYLEYATE